MIEGGFRALDGIYADLDEALRPAAPVCRARGLCCRFRESGHRLYTTPLEFEYLRAQPGFAAADRSLIEEETCPFLSGGRCAVREHRMLGCRIYYCEASFRPRMEALYEEFHGRLKRAMREHGIAYGYFDFLERMKVTLLSGAQTQ